VLSSSCAHKNEEIEQLKKANLELKQKLELRNEEINSFMESFNEIEENLARIRATEKLIVKQTGSGELQGNRVDVVKNDIQAIDDLMKQNRETIRNLSSKLKSTQGENKELSRMIANLEKIVAEKDQEIITLVAQLESLNVEVQNLYTSVTDLKQETTEKTEVINSQDKALNTAYYIIGTEKELKEKEIITTKGGVIGLGKVEKLRQDFPKDLFTEIDIREKNMFTIDAKKVNLLTQHSSDSYLIRKNDNKRYYSFEITNPTEFWKASKYMVLVLD
jgi:chromosome segregation ATPase